MLSNFDLRAHNSLGVPSTAQYYCLARSIADVTAALDFARQRELPIVFIGDGSNLILRRNLMGVVCRLGLAGIEMQATQDEVFVTAAAGHNWHQFVRYCLGRGWAGLEALSLIPGQVGAAPIQNIGAYGTEVAQCVHQVLVLDRESGCTGLLSNAECSFDYRSSVFKQTNAYVVLSVTFRLRPSVARYHRSDEQYPDVARELAMLGKTSASSRELAEAVIRVRRRKLPDVRRVGNVGSVFQNPVVAQPLAKELQAQYAGLTTYPYAQPGHCKMSAAQFIDRLGWKGRSLGDFSVWARQPLVLINRTGAGDGQGMLTLADAIAGDVRTKFGISLVLEPQVLGVDS